jgi:heterodisulfide reductase subunit C
MHSHALIPFSQGTPDRKPLCINPSPEKKSKLAPIRDMIQACIQCGTCTGSCPNEAAMDLTPRHLWRLVLMDQAEAIFQSRTFSLCSACYCCTLRCPRGLPLTEAMEALKRLAAAAHFHRYRDTTLFYREFLESVRRHGRVRETEFMMLYFYAMKKPLLPLRFVPFGLKLMGKGKLPLTLPGRGKEALAGIFEAVASLESRK